MQRIASILIGLLLLATPALAQSTIEQLSPVPTFPLPDPATTTSHLWVTQGCATPAACDYKIDPLSLGSPFQSATPPVAPYPNQLWWNLSSNPATLEAYQNGSWSAVQSRIRLTANLNLWVSPSGSDTNNTCVSSGSPCLTIQHAADVALRNYDVNGNQIIVNIANGTYSAGAGVRGPMIGAGEGFTPPTGNELSMAAPLVFLGNVGSPDSVIITNTGSGTAGFYAETGGFFSVQGVKLAITNGYGVFSSYGGRIQVANDDFGTEVYDIFQDAFAVIEALGNYTITGAKNCHIITAYSGVFRYSNNPVTVTLSGTPSWVNGFTCAVDGSTQAIPAITIFAGAATGPRFLVSQNSFLDTTTNTSNPTFLPGSLPGLLLSGGRYNPPLVPTVSAATGLGTGGSSIIAPGVPSSSQSGGVELLTGTSGTAGSGQFTINFQTAEFKACVVSPTANFLMGSTATVATQTVTSTGTSMVVTWQNGSSGTALTTNFGYFLDYICVAQ